MFTVKFLILLISWEITTPKDSEIISVDPCWFHSYWFL